MSMISSAAIDIMTTSAQFSLWLHLFTIDISSLPQAHAPIPMQAEPSWWRPGLCPSSSPGVSGLLCDSGAVYHWYHWHWHGHHPRQVSTVIWLVNTTYTRLWLVTTMDSIRSKDFEFTRMTLGSEETRALVRAMESQVQDLYITSLSKSAFYKKD